MHSYSCTVNLSMHCVRLNQCETESGRTSDLGMCLFPTFSENPEKNYFSMFYKKTVFPEIKLSPSIQGNAVAY